MCRIIGPWFYIIIAFIIVCFWPLFFLFEGTMPLLSILTVVTIGLFFLAAFYCSSEDLSYYQSFVIIIIPLQSGCANITVIYAVPLICALFYYSLALSIVGFFKGKSFTLFHWQKVVYSFYKRNNFLK